jgi:D-glycero-alpha-D-manno-heptose-7-phosphate kinase
MAALLRARHPDLQAHELATAAYNIERYTLNIPTGIQDSHIAAYGGCLAMEIDRQGRVRTWPVMLPSDLHSRLLLMATGIQRPAADVLRRQSTETSTNLVSRSAMQKIADLGYEIYHDLRGNAGRRFGELTLAHWRAKRATEPGISTPQIDQWIDEGLGLGAEGAKLCGAGAGGYLLFVVPPERREILVTTMANQGLVEMPFRFTPDRAEIIQ